MAIALVSCLAACGDDDGGGNNGAVVRLAGSTGIIGESGEQLTFNVELDADGVIEEDVTVRIADTHVGSATVDRDYRFDEAVVVFEKGSGPGATRAITLEVVQDNAVEGDETIVLAIESAVRARISDPNSITITLVDDEPRVAFVEAQSSVGESDDTASVEVTLTTPSPLQEEVSVAVADLRTGTATRGIDFLTFEPIRVTFPAGSESGATHSIAISLVSDSEVEGPETIELGLRDPRGASLANRHLHALTITDDDVTVSFAAASSSSAAETPATVDVVLNAGSTLTAPVTVDVADAGTGTATSGLDYQEFATSTVTFPAGSVNGDTQSVIVDVIDDELNDDAETVVLRLENPVGAAALQDPTSHVLTITDDDEAAVARVLYRADQDTADVYELYLFDIIDGVATTPVKISGTMTAGGDVSAGETSYGLSADGNWAFYIADQRADLVEEIFLVDLSGGSPAAPVRVSSDLVNATPGDRDVQDGFLSPDSARLVFRSDQGNDSGLPELYEVDLSVAISEGGHTQVSAGLPANTLILEDGLRFSASGDKFLYMLWDLIDGAYVQVRMIDFSAGTDTQVNAALAAGGSIDDAGGFINSTEDLVLWWGEGEQAGVTELFVVDVGVAPFVQTRVGASLASADNAVMHAEFSPDGDSIAYSGDVVTDGKVELYAVDVSAGVGTPQLATPAAAISSVDVPTASIVFSPDSSVLAYTADAESDGTHEVYSVDVTDLSGALSPVKVHATLGNTNSTEPPIAFSPDGSQLLYAGDQVTNNRIELYLASIAAAPVALVASRISQAMGAQNDVEVTSAVPRFNRDGTLIYYRADADSNGVFELYVVDQISGTASAPQAVNATLAGGSTDPEIVVPLNNREQVLYAAQEQAAGTEELILATMPDPSSSGTFARTSIGSGSDVTGVRVQEL